VKIQTRANESGEYHEGEKVSPSGKEGNNIGFRTNDGDLTQREALRKKMSNTGALHQQRIGYHNVQAAKRRRENPNNTERERGRNSDAGI